MPKNLAFTFFISLMLFQLSCTDKKENKLISSPDSTVKFVPDSTFGIYQIPSSNTILAIKYSGRKNLVGYFLRNCVQENFHSKLEEKKGLVYSTIYSTKEKLYYRIAYSKATKEVYLYKQISSQVNHYEEISFIDITPENINVNYNDFDDREKYARKIISLLNRKNIGSQLGSFNNDHSELYFYNDGLCSFRIYDKFDTINENEQRIEVLGMWNYTNKKIMIQWKKNNSMNLITSTYKLDNELQLLNEKDSTQLYNYW